MPDDLDALDASPVRTLDKDAEQRMMDRIDEAKASADTLGGVIEVIAYGVPAGLGTYVESDRRLDAALAGALMGIQAIKGVEVGDGFELARTRGSLAHDEMVPGDGRIHRGAVGDVAIEGGGLAAGGRDLGHHLLRRFEVAVEYRDLGAFARQAPAGGAANAAAAAGHDDGFVL